MTTNWPEAAMTTHPRRTMSCRSENQAVNLPKDRRGSLQVRRRLPRPRVTWRRQLRQGCPEKRAPPLDWHDSENLEHSIILLDSQDDVAVRWLLFRSYHTHLGLSSFAGTL